MRQATDSIYEQLLLLRCQAGDETAFAEIVHRYQHRLHCFIRNLLHEGGQIEDVMQDVWLDVYRGLARLRDLGAFRSWLYRIARDRAFRLLRKKRGNVQSLENVDEIAQTASDEPVSQEETARLHEALKVLSPEHREVILLRFLEDMSYEEIAAITRIKIGTIRSRIHYAKRILRQHLEEVTP